MRKERAFRDLSPKIEKRSARHPICSQNYPLDLEGDLLTDPPAYLQLQSHGDFALAPRLLFLDILGPRVLKINGE